MRVITLNLISIVIINKGNLLNFLILLLKLVLNNYVEFIY